MIWNDHSRLEGAHAFLGASQYSWLNYDEDHLVEVFRNKLAVERGTRLHALACEHIKLGIPIPILNPDQPDTLSLYINDALGFRMTPEVVLYFSENCFGTADAISFRVEKKGKSGGKKQKPTLRIHDLKTGKHQASFKQLDIYAALFCLEYKQNPKDILIEERIYQFNEIAISSPPSEDIAKIMEKIKEFDKVLKQEKAEEGV